MAGAGASAALLADADLPARVTRVDRDRCQVVTVTGDSFALGDPRLAVGDWVALEPSGLDHTPWRVAALADRWSVVERLDVRKGAELLDLRQALAANVDLVASVTPLDRPVSANRIEREMALGWEAGSVPIVVLTKADCHADPAAAAADLEHRLLGVDVLVVRALDGTADAGVAGLLERLRPDRTVMLLGASGAGKSTLANALLAAELLDTGGVRLADSRGRHTTTARHLVPVPGGGVVLDTPGIRSIGLSGDGEGVRAVFADLEQLALGCRFSDCGHDSEPGCAIQAAIAAGTFDAGRLDHWRKLQRELAAERRKLDPLAAAARHAELRRWGRAMKQSKQSRNRR